MKTWSDGGTKCPSPHKSTLFPVFLGNSCHIPILNHVIPPSPSVAAVPPRFLFVQFQSFLSVSTTKQAALQEPISISHILNPLCFYFKRYPSKEIKQKLNYSKITTIMYLQCVHIKAQRKKTQKEGGKTFKFKGWMKEYPAKQVPVINPRLEIYSNVELVCHRCQNTEKRQKREREREKCKKLVTCSCWFWVIQNKNKKIINICNK